MTYIELDYSRVISFLEDYELNKLQNDVHRLHHKIVNKIGPGKTSSGWIDYPIEYDLIEFERILKFAKRVQDDSEILLVIGIGGSYIGARAAIEMLTHSFNNQLSHKKRVLPQIFYVGNNLSSTYMLDLMDLLEGKDFSINVISKSGQTLESALAFRIFRGLLEEKYGSEQASSRIYVTTDRLEGPLKKISTIEGYETFTIQEDIGGRYSVLTAVGLFPMAVSGICIQDVLEGAAKAKMELLENEGVNNIAYQYAIIRNLLYEGGKTIEILVGYEPSLKYFSEWWKQLYAESEGKEKKGIFPTTAIYSTDLHSLGQYVQEGRSDIFETTIRVNKTEHDLMIKETICNLDGLNYLDGKTINFVNNKAFEGTVLAHSEGGIPNIIIEIPTINAFTFGYLVYFFKLACTMSGYLLGVNPFNQPGVEAYKRNMFELLGRPNLEKTK